VELGFEDADIAGFFRSGAVANNQGER
jgi:hypothetical protein